MVTSELIERPQYTDWLQRWKDRDVIKVITGLRRCGKSMVLELFRRSLVAEGIAESRIISINFESLDAHYPTDYQSLYDYIVERLPAELHQLCFSRRSTARRTFRKSCGRTVRA